MIIMIIIVIILIIIILIIIMTCGIYKNILSIQDIISIQNMM